MRHFAANYIFDGNNIIKNSCISVDENGTIRYIGKAGEGLTERPFMIFYNGIICPGMVNAHCHLELSDFEKTDEAGNGMTHFIKSIINKRDKHSDQKKIATCDASMFEKGINLVGDVVNTDKTISTKIDSRIRYHNFIEVSGIKNCETNKKTAFAEQLAIKFTKSGLKNSIVPHAFYSISKNLLDYTVSKAKNEVTSIHFLESEEESDFFTGNKNSLFTFIKEIDPGFTPLASNHKELFELTSKFSEASAMILVHNTVVKNDMPALNNNIFFCLCPSSNMYLHNNLPSKEFVYKNKDKLIAGTDSLASNNTLDILHELKILTNNYPGLSLTDLLKIATRNGAEALQQNNFGQFKEGVTPGIILIENADLINLKITDKSRIKRII